MMYANVNVHEQRAGVDTCMERSLEYYIADTLMNFRVLEGERCALVLVFSVVRAVVNSA